MFLWYCSVTMSNTSKSRLECYARWILLYMATSCINSTSNYYSWSLKLWTGYWMKGKHRSSNSTQKRLTTIVSCLSANVKAIFFEFEPHQNRSNREKMQFWILGYLWFISNLELFLHEWCSKLKHWSASFATEAQSSVVLVFRLGKVCKVMQISIILFLCLEHLEKRWFSGLFIL